jgi:hypothetical protein
MARSISEKDSARSQVSSFLLASHHETAQVRLLVSGWGLPALSVEPRIKIDVAVLAFPQRRSFTESVPLVPEAMGLNIGGPAGGSAICWREDTIAGSASDFFRCHAGEL